MSGRRDHCLLKEATDLQLGDVGDVVRRRVIQLAQQRAHGPPQRPRLRLRQRQPRVHRVVALPVSVRVSIWVKVQLGFDLLQVVILREALNTTSMRERWRLTLTLNQLCSARNTGGQAVSQ